MRNLTKKHLIMTALTVTSIMATSSVFANEANGVAVSSAFTAVALLVGMLAPGLIGLAAVMLGVGVAISWLRK